jgi:exodeoxyribonuclease VII large subunit
MIPPGKLALQPDPSPQLGLNFDEPRNARRVWPVRELVGQVRELIEKEYGDVWVEGEISNFRPAPSGHLYFTLKDAEAQLPIVLFRRQATLLRFRPEDGLHVLVRGHLSIYEQRGQMQLVAETMEPVGAGSLQLAFEQLKERLKSEGLFDADRKKPLPAFPRTVGIVTSPTGAVIRDFLNIVARRHSGLNVLLVPVSVQGDQAPAEIETPSLISTRPVSSTSSYWRAAADPSKTSPPSTPSALPAPLHRAASPSFPP